MENITKGKGYDVRDGPENWGIVVSIANTIVWAMDIVQRAKDKHQKKQLFLSKVVGCFFDNQ